MNVRSAGHRFHEDYFEAYEKDTDGIENAIRYVWEDNSELQKMYLSQLIIGVLGAVCKFFKTSSLKNMQMWL